METVHTRTHQHGPRRNRRVGPETLTLTVGLSGRALFLSAGTATFSLLSTGAVCHFLAEFYPVTGEIDLGILFWRRERGTAGVVRARVVVVFFFSFVFFVFEREHTAAVPFPQNGLSIRSVC